MVVYNPTIQKHQLILAENIARRLWLLDRDKQPLQIVHVDAGLLEDLELEIMHRYRVREMDWQRNKREERWQERLSLPLLLVVLFGSQFLPLLGQRFGISATILNSAFYILVALVYGLFHWLAGRHQRPSEETALVEDWQLVVWIRKHCTR